MDWKNIAVGTLAGGLISLLITYVFNVKNDKKLNMVYDDIKKEVTLISHAVELKENGMFGGFNRDIKGHPTGVKANLSGRIKGTSSITAIATSTRRKLSKER